MGVTLARQRGASRPAPTPGALSCPLFLSQCSASSPGGAGSPALAAASWPESRPQPALDTAAPFLPASLPSHSPAPDSSFHASPFSFRGFPASLRVPSRHCSSAPSTPVPRQPHHHLWRRIKRKPPPQTLQCVSARSPLLLGPGTPRALPPPGPTPCSRGSAWEARGL